MPALTSTAQPKWISPKDAVELIESDTPERPVIDLKKMMKAVEVGCIKRGFNLSIYMQKKVNGRLVSTGMVPCHLETDLDVVTIKESIKEAYKRSTGREFDEEPVKLMDSVAQPGNVMSSNNAGGRRKKSTPHTKKGEVMVSGDITTGTNVTTMEGSDGLLGGLDK